jgi:hypothetical protein
MLINDIISLLNDIPPMLAAQWGAWFVVGLVLAVWTRREKARLIIHGPEPRQKSGPRQAAPRRVTAKKAPAAAAAGPDAFGELEALFNEVHEGSHRMPGEAGGAAPAADAPAPSVNEPLRSAPVLAAPQSLP